jgi:hypothetical protein
MELRLNGAESLRLKRLVFSNFSILVLSVKDKEGRELLELRVLDGQYDPEHHPIPVIWEEAEGVDFVPRAVDKQRMLNNPEPEALTKAREILMSYDDESEHPADILRAIHEAIFGEVK